MGGRHAGALIVAIGCGRVGFDPLADSATSAPDAAFALPCPLGSTAPDPLVITASKNGVTFAHHIVEVLAGDNVVFTPVRPLP